MGILLDDNASDIYHGRQAADNLVCSHSLHLKADNALTLEA